MPTRTVKYWFKTDLTTFIPLACTRRELDTEMYERDLMWCKECKAAVEPEGVLTAQGLHSECPWCCTELEE